MKLYRTSTLPFFPNRFLWVVLLCCMALVACLAAFFNPIITLIAASFSAALFIVIYCLINPLMGFYLACIISFFISLPTKITGTPIPISTGLEFLVVIILVAALRKQKSSLKKFFRSPASIALLIFFILIGLEFFNKNAYSIQGWLFYMRRLLMFIFIYIASYLLLDSPEKISKFLKLWFGMVVFCGIYGCFQNWYGLLPFEMRYLQDNPHEYMLYFQGGKMRVFSILSDPSTFGNLCGISAVFTIIMSFNTKGRKRILALVSSAILILAMAFSGTRTSMITLPAGLFLYSIMTIHSRVTLVGVTIIMALLAFALFGPFQNSTTYRLKSIFDKEESSLNVRNINRQYIQPYIYEHPFGGGVMTAGLQGEKYNPQHRLAGFPPDSGFLLYALELGWIGYGITMLVYFMILYQGIQAYFALSPQYKWHKYIIAGLTCSLFALFVTQYAQVSIGQLPTSFYFYAALGIILRLKQLANDQVSKYENTHYKLHHYEN